jgi:hypothetical protein
MTGRGAKAPPNIAAFKDMGGMDFHHPAQLKLNFTELS